MDSAIRGLFDEAMRAVESELEAAKEYPKTELIGQAKRLADRGPLVIFQVADPVGALLNANIEDLFLASTPRSQRFAVRHIERTTARSVAVGVDRSTPTQELSLFRVDSPTVILEALIKELGECTDAKMAAHFCVGRISRSLPISHPGLNTEQQQALGDICGRGLGAVWGPPGTGKTKVIGAAVEQMLAKGQTVAIVSITNVAVDQALLKVSESLPSFEPGRIVRVGVSTNAEGLKHPHLAVAKAAELLNVAIVQERGKLQLELDALKATDPAPELAPLLSEIAPETRGSLYNLDQQRTVLHMRSTAAAELESCEQSLKTVRANVLATEKSFDESKAEVEQLAPYRPVLENEQRCLALDLEDQMGVDRLKQLDRQLLEVSSISMLKRGAARKELLRQKQDVQATLDNRRAELAQRRAYLQKAAVYGVTGKRVLEADRALQADTAQLIHLEEESQRLDRGRSNFIETVQRFADVQPLSEVQERVLQVVDRYGGQQALGRRIDELNKSKRDHQKLQQSITTKMAELQHRLAESETVVAREAQVVGTTFAQLLLHRGLQGRTFDQVIVDEATFALPPYVLASLSRAAHGATLIGTSNRTSR